MNPSTAPSSAHRDGLKKEGLSKSDLLFADFVKLGSEILYF